MAFIDVHILQAVPPSNINRDDTGSPKTAVFGGVRRARVSSQAWKRATRRRFNATLNRSDIGYRTKQIVELLVDEIRSIDTSIELPDAELAASNAFGSAGIKVTKPRPAKNAPEDDVGMSEAGYLVFLSTNQFHKLAELAIAAHRAGAKIGSKEAKAAINSDHSFDVALFGRMVADDAELSVDAAAQVAHAISVHAVEPEFDYYTAIDDLKEEDKETGAGMIGTVEFNSSTLYRYATVSVHGLRANLGDDAATARATAAFVESLALSMPTGKQNSFANRTVPDAILVSVRADQPVNLVGAFENPVQLGAETSTVRTAVRELVKRDKEVASAYGAPSYRWYVSVGDAVEPLEGHGDRVSVSELVDQLETHVLGLLGESL
ncbi:type I-E CRISPR-associated protein Cas7/Cse4/CasC [Hoyosella sp. YIM 151337]|uniref:type I-E CRISPR-associated protein Cas7/Cse4/CasC n=1 Tax=Hoyosella sp. YIM 151337 TaxID=2992742 RepID=UPI0022357ED8|nr:type I-E CRISPR-associated protein Cas7/Cse4/CasC [Hoyosella sp. YIM 151337]MCW4353527.1 type I-E CRISPR-associated protein Cas7/Cse4/CasC [Hoyosella sp. YIM 151337]